MAKVVAGGTRSDLTYSDAFWVLAMHVYLVFGAKRMAPMSKGCISVKGSAKQNFF